MYLKKMIANRYLIKDDAFDVWYSNNIENLNYDIKKRIDEILEKIVYYFQEKNLWDKKTLFYYVYTVICVVLPKINVTNLKLENVESFVNFVESFIKEKSEQYSTCLKNGIKNEDQVYIMIWRDLRSTLLNILEN